jgi:hypothetical protein
MIETVLGVAISITTLINLVIQIIEHYYSIKDGKVNKKGRR